MPTIPSVGGSTTSAGVVSSVTQGRGPGLPSASIVRLRDVARIDLGALNYTTACTFDGKPSVGLGVYQLPGTNALDVAVAVRAKMEELKTRFPDGVEYDIGYDTTPYIRESVWDVLMTLLEAVVLVGVVVLVFLQSWRSVLIPLVAVPVAIVGTFAVMAALRLRWIMPTFNLASITSRFSAWYWPLASWSMMPLSWSKMSSAGSNTACDLRTATRKAMGEVTGPIIAVALVLCAVFVPCAFISGITGQFFRQFGVTIAVSTVFSAINSLTLSPALAAILLKPQGGRRDPLTWLLDMALGWFFWLFNKVFGISTAGYAWIGRQIDAPQSRGSDRLCRAAGV